MSDKKYVIGIDIGGTNIRIGLIDEKYQLSHFTIGSSSEIIDGKHTADKLVSFIGDYLEKQQIRDDIAAISIGFPSIIDKERKVVLSTPNIKGLNNVNIVEKMEGELQIPTFIDKDVNMLMIYDMYRGSVPDSGVAVGFYLGTGLGNAISIDGELLIGKNGAAAELGHIPAKGVEGKCGCGNSSCVEIFASGKHLRVLCEEQLGGVFIEDVFTEYSSHPVIQEYIRDVALPIASEINILDPDYIILGGGVMQMRDFPKKQLEAAIRMYARKPYPEQNLAFIYSIPEQMNGVIGAGIYGRKKWKKRQRKGLAG